MQKQKVVCPNCGSDDVVPVWKWGLAAGVFGFFISLLFIWIPVIGILGLLGAVGGLIWSIKQAIFNRNLYKCGNCKVKRFVLEKN